MFRHHIVKTSLCGVGFVVVVVAEPKTLQCFHPEITKVFVVVVVVTVINIMI